ncbi:MAG: anaerobic sulfatase maturase [Lachnospiraceae bacterium]|nr:anaerobic sulfatase maturase [Lachnospiraceae bacterium]
MPAASILIKPTSANCNMDCKYCFYKCLSSNREEYSKGFMTEDTLEQLVIRAFEYADGAVTFAFQGGEPTLAGIPFFRKAVELQKKYNQKGILVENTIQTNGLLIDEEWAEFLAENHFLVGLSLDGPRKMHDAARLDVKGEGTFERLMRTVSILKQYRVDFNILTVVTNETAVNASALYKFYQRNHFSYVQLIPCMDESGRNESNGGNSNPYAVTPEAYGNFLCHFFDLWYEDFKRGEIMDVRMFSNLAQMTVGYPPEECGMSGCCNCYFVVEGDGSVYPCDFYCMDEWKLGTVAESFSDLMKVERAEKFVEDSRFVSEECRTCSYVSLCRGGCRRWREPFTDGKPGLNYLCPAYRIFFPHVWERLQRLGQTIIHPESRKNL